jgi:hypothetical protein
MIKYLLLVLALMASGMTGVKSSSTSDEVAEVAGVAGLVSPEAGEVLNLGAAADAAYNGNILSAAGDLAAAYEDSEGNTVTAAVIDEL